MDAPAVSGTNVGAELHAFASRLYPICRSITGAGLRQTLALIQERIPLRVVEVPSGKAVFDWEVPLEWNIEDAAIRDPDGRRLADFRVHNLHLVNYSEPVSRTLSLQELQPQLHSLPERPDWIPYRTSYYKRAWGFCLTHREREALRSGTYGVEVKSSFRKGSLSYGECLVRGKLKDEVVFFTHVCHPSLANDNTSGMSIATWLAAWISSAPRRYSYRFVFAPGTIGTLCWLKANETNLGRMKHGLVLALLGDRAGLTYKRSRREDAAIDRIVPFALRELTEMNPDDPTGPAKTIPFEPYGYDERQLCSPGFNLPVGRLTRSVNGGYPEYHSSADDLTLIKPESLARSLEACRRVVEIIETDRRYVNLLPKGEPRLGKRGLYGSMGGTKSPLERERAMLWVLNQSDGGRSLLDISERAGLRFEDVASVAAELQEAGLLKEARGGGGVARRPTRRSKR